MTTVGTPIYRPWPGPVLRLLMTTVVVLVLPVLLVLVLFRFTDAASTKQARDLARDNTVLQERQDCARSIANDQTALVNALTVAKARLDERFVVASLADPEQRAVMAPELAGLADQLDAAIVKVEALPPTQELVAKQCPSVHGGT